MNCLQAREILEDAVDSPDATAHAALCPDCAAFRAELLTYQALMGTSPEISVPGDLETKLLKAVRRSRPNPVRQTVRRIAACSVLGVAALGILMSVSAADTREQETVRRRDEAQRQFDAISQQVERDHALFVSDPMSGTPVVAFTGHARR